MSSQARKASHSVYSVLLHFVFVTKYRRKVITSPILEKMKEVFEGVCQKTGCILVEFSGEEEHVHLLIDFHPNNNISAFAGSLKAASSRIIRKEFAETINKFYKKPVFWSSSFYVASSGGAPIARLKEYIKSQDKPQ